MPTCYNSGLRNPEARGGRPLSKCSLMDINDQMLCGWTSWENSAWCLPSHHQCSFLSLLLHQLWLQVVFKVLSGSRRLFYGCKGEKMKEVAEEELSFGYFASLSEATPAYGLLAVLMRCVLCILSELRSGLREETDLTRPRRCCLVQLMLLTSSFLSSFCSVAKVGLYAWSNEFVICSCFQVMQVKTCNSHGFCNVKSVFWPHCSKL